MGYVLQTYAIDDFIARTDADAALTPYIQPSITSPAQYAEALVKKYLRHGEVYD